MSSQPSRDVMSNDWFISVCQRNRKSVPVIALPSLHFAAFLYEKRTVSGFAFSIFGWAVKSTGMSVPRLLYSKPPSSTGSVASAVANRFPSVMYGLRTFGSWSRP